MLAYHYQLKKQNRNIKNKNLKFKKVYLKKMVLTKIELKMYISPFLPK